MKTRKTIFLTIFCLFAFVCLSFAQAPAGSAPASGASAKKTCPPYDDPNKKGDPAPIVEAIDADKDGKMTKAEWEKAGAPIASFQMFTERSKKDHVTKEEFMVETPPDGVDADCDGKFTIKEFHDFGLQGPPGGAPGGAGAPPAGGAPAGGAK